MIIKMIKMIKKKLFWRMEIRLFYIIDYQMIQMNPGSRLVPISIF